jgi:peptidoglycan/LPS O-acetylase OafA/YrhL
MSKIIETSTPRREFCNSISTNPDGGSRLMGLDFARSAAIGLVVLSHYFHPLHELGPFGVEWFFALSGYLIGGILLRRLAQAESWGVAGTFNFWRRRWWRTLPNYFLFMLVMVVFHGLVGGLPTWTEFFKYLFFWQSMTHGPLGFFGVSWSLCVEEWFYVLFPLTVGLMSSFLGSAQRAFHLTLVLFIVVCFSGRWFLACSGVDEDSLRMMTLIRLDAIAYGVMVITFVRQFRIEEQARLILAGLGLALLAAGAYLHSFLLVNPFCASMLGVLPVMGFALILPWLECSQIVTSSSILAKAMTKISLWSYSIYLCHIPVQRLVYAIFGELRVEWWINLFSKFIGIGTSLVVSALCYHFFEHKMTLRRPPEKWV